MRCVRSEFKRILRCKQCAALGHLGRLFRRCSGELGATRVARCGSNGNLCEPRRVHPLGRLRLLDGWPTSLTLSADLCRNEVNEGAPLLAGFEKWEARTTAS